MDEIKKVASILALRAEKLLKSRSPNAEEQLTINQTLNLIHELEVYQIELELQNNELEVQKEELELQNDELIGEKVISNITIEKYINLYDFAPSGYFSLNKEGEITDINIHAARMLGKKRSLLINNRFGFLISDDSKPVFNNLLEILFNSCSKAACEVLISANDDHTKHVLLSGLHYDKDNLCFISMIDITERKQDETYREMSREVLQILNEQGDINYSIQRTLEVLKSGTGFDAVGMRLQAGNDIPYRAHTGFSGDCMLTEPTLLEFDKVGKGCDDQYGNISLTCSCGQVISGQDRVNNSCFTPGGSWRTNDSFLSGDVSPKADAGLRRTCNHKGYASVALVPIRNNEKTVGLMQFSDKRKDQFNPHTIEILEEIVSHIGAVLMRRQAEETLRKNEELLRTITTNGSDIIIQLDQNGSILYTNRALPGYTMEKTVGINFCEWTLPEYHELMNQSLKLVFSKGTTQTFHTQGQDPTGEMRWYRNSISPVKAGDMVMNTAILINQDITDSKQAEKALFESTEHFRLLFENSSDAILYTNPDGAIYLANPEAERMLERSKEEIVNLTRSEIIDMNDPRLKPALEERRETGRFSGELNLLRKDETIFPAELTSTIFKDSRGNERSSMIIHDITKRKQAEQSLIESKEYYRTLFDSMIEGFCVIEMIFDENMKPVDYLFLETNSAFEEQSGLKDVEGKLMRDIAPDMEDYWFDMYGKIALTGELMRFENEAKALNRWFEICAFRMGGPDSRKVAVCFSDITERKQAEELLHINNLRLTLAMHTGKMAWWEMDLLTGNVVFDKAKVEMLGYQPEEFTNYRDFMALVHPDDNESCMTAMRNHFEGRADRYEVDYRILMKSGEYLWCSDIGSISKRDEHGKPLSIIGLASNINERKQAENEILVNNARLTLAMKVSNMAWWEMNIATGAITFEKRKAEMLGYLAENFKQYTDFMTLVHPKDAEKAMKAMRRLINGSVDKYEVEYRILSQSGEYVWLYEIGSVTNRDENGKALLVTGLIINITERKEAEVELQESEKSLSDIYESMSEGLSLNEIIYDAEGKAIDYRLTDANPAFEKITGQKRSEVIGKKGSQRYLSEQAPNLDIYAQVAATGEPASFEIFFRPSNKYLSISVFSPAKGKFVTLFRDITELKQAEQSLQESEDMFRNLVLDMQVGVIIQDPQAIILMSNPKALELLGVDEAQLLGKTSFDPYWNVIHEDGSPFPGNTHPVAQAIATRLSVRNVVMGVYRPATQDIAWLLVAAEPQLFENGIVRSVVCTFVEITSRKKAEEELRESEQRLKYHFENSPLAILEWDNELLIKQWSIEAEKIFGWKKEETIGRRIDSLNLVLEEDLPMMNNMMERLSSGNENTVISTTRNVTKEGTMLECTWYNSILLDKEGQSATVMSLVQDITLQKQAENALKQLNEELEDRVHERTAELEKSHHALRITEEKYRTVANFATNWEFWIDENDTMIYCSPSCEQKSGYTANEFIENSQLILEIIHPDDLLAFKEHKVHEMTAQVSNHEVQYRIIRKDGAVRWMGHFCKPVFDASGTFKGTRGSNKDITARKKIEEMLTTSNQKYKLLSENITEGIFICKNGRFEYINHALYAIFGYRGTELEDMMLTHLLMTDRNDELDKILYSKDQTNRSCNIEMRCMKKDLSFIYIEILLNYVSKDKKVYGVIHDITERKDLEKNILKAIIQTEEKERISFSRELHEGLGPLLSTIKLYIQWSERPNSNKSRVEIMVKTAEILDEAITTVKEISAKLSPHLLTNYGLHSAIKSFVDKLNHTASCHIVFESNSTRRMEVEVETSLYRAVLECINNSLKHARADNIYIKLDDSGDEIQILYTDDGIGFDIPAVLAQQKGLGIFNLQNRLHTIGGKVELKSEPGKGVEYHFTVKA